MTSLSTMDHMIVCSTGTQTEQLTSPILWHCLHVVKSSPEFKGLSYRVATDMNGNELLIINRDQVTRVFGPPVEPISLTLDPSGRCLLAIPFRAVQHIPITKTKSGILDQASLYALLQLVAGKGFCFCPGIPAKFLAGRACGKFLVMHRTPFKRFSAVRCPVYFKLPKSMDSAKGGQLPIRTLCPSCRQVAKWAQTLPISQNPVRPPPVINPVRQSHVLYPVPAGSTDMNAAQIRNSNTPIEIKPAAGVDHQRLMTNAVVTSVKERLPGSGVSPQSVVDSSRQEGTNPVHASTVPDVLRGDSNVSDMALKRRQGLNSEKAQAVSDSLRQLLKQRSMLRESPADLAAKLKMDLMGQNRGEKSRPRSPRSEKSKKNVCRICQKQFSSNLKLSKHVQRHEGNRPQLSQVLRRKMRRRKSSVILNSFLKGFTTHSSSKRKNSSVFSEWSLQLILNSLNDLLSNEIKLNADVTKTSKAAPEKKRARGKRKAEEYVPQQHVGNLPIRPGLHRSGSGLAAVQTLLNAAQMADDDDANRVSNLTNSSNFTGMNGLDLEFSNTDHVAKRDTESPSSAKKARQSGRLAAKKADKKSKHAADSKGDSNHVPLQGSIASNNVMPPAHPFDEALTNLNLLSTVSLQAEFGDNKGSPGLQLLSIAGNLDSKRNSMSQNAKGSNKPGPLSQSAPVNSLPTIAANQRIATFVLSNKDTTTASKNNTTLPPIPPLILAMDTIMHRHPSPHSSNTSSPSVQIAPSLSSAFPIRQQLHHNITKSNTPNVNLPREDVLGSDCGAMDLSKPKSIQPVKAAAALTAVSSTNNAPPPLPQDSADVLRQFMMINPMSVPQKPSSQPEPVSDPRIRLLSSKEADDSLQARMFASAKNYKVDPMKLIATGHIPGVVLSSASGPSTTTTGKQGKGKDKMNATNVPSAVCDKSEIQCGYKWSGSGGLVKERTQLVRELVPSVVMANILSGPSLALPVPKMDNPISAPMQNVTKSKVSGNKRSLQDQLPQQIARRQQQQQLQQQHLASKSSQLPIPMTSQNSSTPQHITLKPREALVRPKTPQFVLNLSKNRNDHEAQPGGISNPIQIHNKSLPVPFPASILKTSLLNTPSVLIPTSVFAGQKPIAPNTTPSSANKKLIPNTSVLAPLRNTILATLPSVVLPAPQPPNSTLATILRHPAKVVGSHPTSKGPEVNFSVAASSAVVPISSSAKPGTVVELTEIKSEPIEVYNNNGSLHTVIPNAHGEATVVKIEKPVRESPPMSGGRDSSTPPNLVVDMGADKNAGYTKPNTGKANSGGGGNRVVKGKVSIVNNPLKCEFCRQVFRTIRDHDYHVCPRKP